MTDRNDSLGSLRMFECDDTSFACQSILFENRHLLRFNRYYVH